MTTTAIERTVTKNFIDGSWTATAATTLIDVFDSNTGQVIGKAPASTATDADRAVAAAKKAQPAWRALNPKIRGQYLRAIAQGLTDRQEELAQSISREVGCTLELSRGSQTATPIHSFNTAADIAEGYEYRTKLNNSWIVREPLGVVGAITAWNFPLHLVTVKSAFAMAAGNTVVVKPSEVAPLTAAILCEIVAEAGLPAGVFNVVFGTGPDVGEAIVNNQDVNMISFTGSTRAGMRIGEVAASQVKKVALELGGKSPLVILDSANLEAAVTFGMADCFTNNGQRCDALTRMVVPRAKLAEAEKYAAKIANDFVVGSSVAEDTTIGPMVSAVQAERVAGYIKQGIAEGARLVVGGPDAPALQDELTAGYFVQPTIFTDVTPEMTIAQEEIFGPVLVLQPYDTVEEAVHLANNTDYGLHASVWAKDDSEAIDIANRIDAGMITINNGAFNPAAPFGGYKHSGLGREFGNFGFEEFLEVKTMQTSKTL